MIPTAKPSRSCCPASTSPCVPGGAYDDANAVSFTAPGVVGRNLLKPGRGTLTLDGGVGFGTSKGQVVGRAGASFGW